MSQAAQISVAIITLNEADRIAECVKSVRFADEIVVVDSGSVDGTQETARALGCKVYAHPFAGFSRQKQYAVDRCSHDWVLILDADERLPAITATQITQSLSGVNEEIAAFSLLRRNYLHGRWIRHCGWWPDKVVRLVRRDRGAFSPHTVHERWITDGRIEQLSLHMDHFSFRSYAEMIEKLQHYSTLAAQEMASLKVNVHFWSPLLHGAWMFFTVYVLKLGFLCGFDGLIISLLNAGGSFMKYAKCWEMIHHGMPALEKHKDDED
jgi:(heptosyl)LPS beta-1,4-glucosyltransferase